MHDIVIRGGTIVDGTGSPGYIGDVAIDGDKIASVGGKAGPGKREIDAKGLLVTPGWVDAHTHYDGQATWDPILAPSSWHGVTTILFGNYSTGEEGAVDIESEWTAQKRDGAEKHSKIKTQLPRSSQKTA